MSEPWLTSSQAAVYLGVSLATIRRWANDGKLPHWRTPGGQRRFDVGELDEWRERHYQESSE